ncbi:hypothetical protein J1TS5_03240 [Paenibacillus macerans]|uniref:hypothetical protein n=1 Tax=Paenibacillus macerans TaxID=44252 RepID=UPI001B2F4571|nr:hypothetical protein [Paenibacillus macerans]GIP08154.1 hypothetical protein J1TS5_03240 [Paenibacillus macerans]
MSDWKETISQKFAAINARRAEIHKPLYALVQELSRESSIREADLELVSEHPLIWSVSINGRVVQISENDVDLAQRIYNEPFDSSISEDRKDITEALKELLVQKFQ